MYKNLLKTVGKSAFPYGFEQQIKE